MSATRRPDRLETSFLRIAHSGANDQQLLTDQEFELICTMQNDNPDLLHIEPNDIPKWVGFGQWVISDPEAG
ncbi:MAG: hypothetical protein HQL82_16555 [Magnetococcales bacterium]|nr:hypothetical protein [Magnetococcales bacterium]